MFGFIRKLFGTQSQKTLKALEPYIKQINEIYEKLRSLSHDQLRQQTHLLKDQIKHQTNEEYTAMTTAKEQAKRSHNITEKSKLFKKLHSLQKKYDAKLEKTLLTLLPQAFAIVKETTRRFKENKTLHVQATEYDKTLAKKHDHIKIIDHKACWYNTWRAGGQKVIWNMIPYDVQLIGGIVLHQGKIAEMATGEGKTLAAILPAFLNALTNKGVHIVTVNDYLAKRDAEWVGPIFQFHGLTVDCIDKHPSHSQQRKQAYLADISYGTNNEFGFDYLRDNMVASPEEKVQRGHTYAIVDEVDSVLIDDARTPLIISGPASYDDTESYYLFNPLVHQLYKAQHQLIVNLLKEAQQNIKENKTKEAGICLFRIYRGLPKHPPFIQHLSQKGMKKLLHETENTFLEDNSRKMPEADEPLFFIVEEKTNTVELTEKGTAYLTKQGEDPDFFILPDIATQIANVENDTTLSNQEKINKRTELTNDYSDKSNRIHIIKQSLKSRVFFTKGIEYVVINQQVKIVDEQTGRILPGRRYSEGLHQAIEAKENVKVEKPSQTYATHTFQTYFPMYDKLAGMTGTAETEAKELWEIYKLEVVVIPTHKPIIRQDRDDKIYKTEEEKLDAIAQEIVTLHQQGRPVLAQAPSVEGSYKAHQAVKKLLKKANIQLLNAKNHEKESTIVANAGQEGAVTISNPMSGRGTDIKLTDEVIPLGGLHVVGTERNESRRVDRQLRGRSGRQGDPGSSQFYISLEDPLMAHFKHGFIGSQMDKIFHQKGEAIQDPRITNAIESAQKRLEENHFASRKRLLEYDQVMNMQRRVIYKKRDHALYRNRLDLDIMHMLHQTLTNIVTKAQTQENSYKSFELDIISTLGIELNITSKELINQPAKQLIKQLYEKAYNTYLQKKDNTQTTFNHLFKNIEQPPQSQEIPFYFSFDKDSTNPIHTNINLTQTIASGGKAAVQTLESSIVLHYIDEHWKYHLQRMDALKEASGNAVYEQKDPLLIYKFEGHELFKQLINTINKEIITSLFKIDLVAPTLTQAANNDFAHAQPNLQETKYQYHNDAILPTKQAITPMRTTKIASRNQRVTVKYTDGKIKENVKFKTIADDFEKKRCIIVSST